MTFFDQFLDPDYICPCPRCTAARVRLGAVGDTTTAPTMNKRCVDSSGEEAHAWEEHSDPLTGDEIVVCDDCGEQMNLSELDDGDD